MLTDVIKQSEAYKAFIGYSTGLVSPKKTRGKGSKGKQQEVTTKKKTIITIDDNIITDDPNVAFELGNSISKTDAEVADDTRRIHETHARLVTEKAVSKEAYEESGGELAHRVTGRRRTQGVTISDTLRVSKKKSVDQSQKLKGIQTLTTEEQLAADTMQALKASKNSSRSQSHTGGSSEGTGIIPGVPDESTVFFTTLSEGTGTIPGVPNGAKDEIKGVEKEKVDEEEIEWVSTDEEDEQQDDHDDDDDRSIDIERTNDEKETDDEFVHGDEYVHGTMDEEMKDAASDLEQAGKLPLTSSILSVSSNFGNQFLNLSSNTSLIGITKKSADTEINSLLDIQIQQEVPHIQSPSILTIPDLVIPKPTVVSPIPEIPIVTPVITLPPPPFITNITPILQQKSTPIPTPPITTTAPAATTVLDPLLTIIKRVSELEEDVQELKQVDPSPSILATIRSQVLVAVDKYLGSSLGDTLQKNKKEKAEKQQMPEYLVKSSDKAAFDEYDQKSSLFQTMMESKSFNKHPAHKALYHDLIESLLADGEGMDQGVTDSLKKKRQHDHQDEGPSARPNLGIMDTANDNVVNDVDQPHDESIPKTTREPRINWFTQPLRPLTLDPEWNKGKEVDNGQEHTWFTDLLSAEKAPLTFDELMATPIDFSNFAMNRLKIDKLTKANLVGPVYNLFKGTCQSSIELKYNMEECYKALSDQLDWNNPEKYHCPFDLSKPLPLKGRIGHLTVASKYFFNNDLEYLKSSNPEKKYTTSITKTKAARYELVGIEDMIYNLWSVTDVSLQCSRSMVDSCQTYANPMLVLILILTGSGVGVDTAYPRHGYAVSSLMDTAY
ncbi:hypothetical protein Tco_0477702 [Tanacetum coccineum]